MNIWDSYFEWLLKRLKWSKKGYNELLHRLFDRKFTIVLDRDINRLKDGEYLRNRFFVDIGISGDFKEHPISVLEVLIALSERIETEYIGNPSDPRPDIIFWELLCNLGLNSVCFTDSRINKPANLYNFDQIIDTFLERRYDFYGNGNIFPLKSVSFDVAEMEIWDQMQAYLSENYGDFW